MSKTVKHLLKDSAKAVLTPIFRRSEDSIKNQIDKYTTISFDVFDTLLERYNDLVKHPTDVFGLVEERVGIVGFKRLRLIAESVARMRTDKEDIGISEIYDCIGLDEINKHLCLNTELEIETEVGRVKDAGKRLYNYALNHNKRVVVISNMYLSEVFIDSLLRRHGYNNYEKLFVSCEYGKKKGTGNLYREVRSYLQEETWFHIGDDLFADGFGAKRAGVSYSVL